MAKKSLILPIALLLLLIACTNAQNEPPTIEYIAITELVDTNIRYDRFELSPSGRFLAILGREELCVYDIGADILECTLQPLDDDDINTLASLSIIYLTWSPNEQYLALANHPHYSASLGRDIDIWLYDITSKQFKNLTDDGIKGYYNSYEDDGSFVTLDADVDFFPLWDKSSQNIYFFRSVPDDEYRLLLDMSVYRVSLANDEVHGVYSLPEIFDPFIHQASISPDGTQLAMVLGTLRDDKSQSGIWLVNLGEGTFEQVIQKDRFSEGLTGDVEAWVDEITVWSFDWYENLVWQNNNTLLALLKAYGEDIESDTTYPMGLHYFSVQLEPVSIEPFTFDLTDNDSPTDEIPYTVLIEQDSDNQILVVVDYENKKQYFYWGNDSEGFEMIGEIPYLGSTSQPRLTKITQNGNVLSGGHLITIKH